MPSIIATTTSRSLEAAIIAAIATLVPSEESGQELGWIPMEENRDAGTSSMVPRLFRIEINTTGLVVGGLTGNGDNELSLALDIFVDYRGFPKEDRGWLLEADQWDLYFHLENQINVIPGLTHVEIAADPTPEGDEDEARFVYSFTVYYMRVRR